MKRTKKQRLRKKSMQQSKLLRQNGPKKPLKPRRSVRKLKRSIRKLMKSIGKQTL